MPNLVREVADERDALLAFLAEQRAGLRRAAHGLTDEQAASRPSASALSIAVLVKHAARCEKGWIDLMVGRSETRGLQGYEDQFRVREGETLAGLLDAYADVARETEETVAALPDLEGSVALPEAPWFPPGSKRSARWILLHLVEEAARHAGHADIIRESLDGATAYELMAATGL